MKKVLIVDDEYLQRELVKSTVAWEQLGLCIAAEASDGREAVETAERVRPDIIIMDINIPFLNGLEVSKRVKEILPETQIIILTAYGEFEYAREAIRFGAVNFLLKPLDPEELEKELRSACAKIEDIRKQFFVERLAGFQKEGDAEKYREYGFPVDEKICLIYFRFSEEESLRCWRQEIQDLIEERFPKTEVLDMQSDLIFLLAEDPQVEEFRFRIRSACACVWEEMGEKSGLCGSASDIHDSVAEIHMAYKEAYEGLSVYGRRCGINFYESRGVRKILESGLSLMEQRLVPSGRKKVEEAKQYIDENYWNGDLNLNLIAENIGVNPSYLSSIFKKEYGCSLSRYLISVRMEKGRQMMEESPDITVSEAAELTGYSDAYYFSKSFKQQFGISPSKYLREYGKN